jgi:RNA polymerase sigma factor (sigma-70 family)
LRRNVPNLDQPRREREREDLFQEGCLGLIRAAVSFRPESGIAFAAYALPRIHNAVSTALRTKFSHIQVPRARRRRSRADAAVEEDGSDRRSRREARHSPEGPGAPISEPAARPLRAHSLNAHSVRHMTDRRASEETSRVDDTIGVRLRDKYERAVREVEVEANGRGSIRGDRDELVRILVEQRFLIPADEDKRAMRQIARDTRSSYARVAQCEKRFSERLRRRLEGDPEFRELERIRKTDPQGVNAALDNGIEDRLTDACAADFLRRFRDADRTRRAEMLYAMLDLTEPQVEQMIRSRFTELPSQAREQVFSQIAKD